MLRRPEAAYVPAAFAALALAGCVGLIPGGVRPSPTGRHLDESGLEQPLPAAVYYTDLGPAEIDVSSYPEAQKRAYTTFRGACGACHTLARAVNSPTQSRTYWRFHLARMSMHSRFQKIPRLSAEEREAVLDFLVHDARVRKIEGRAEFERSDEELKRRFDPILQQYLWELYQGRGVRTPHAGPGGQDHEDRP